MGELTVAAGLASALIGFAASKGASREALAERSGIDLARLDDADGRVPLDAYVGLMRAAKSLTGDPALALRFGEAVEMSSFSVLAFLAPASGSLAEGLAQLNRYARLLIEVDASGGDRFRLDRRKGKVWLVDARPNPNDFPELTESTFARMVSAARRCGMPAVGAEVHVSHVAPAHVAEYERVFQVPVRFDSGWNAIGADEAMLALPAVPEPGYAAAVMREHAEALLDSLDRSKSLRGRVENLLAPMLAQGTIRIDAVAREMGLSRQTLYRKLRAEDVTFEQLLDELRHRLAVEYLRDRNLPVSEAAHLLGFSDRAAFSRAFKRWTGSSPGAMRET